MTKYFDISAIALFSIVLSFATLQIQGAPISNQTDPTVAPINKIKDQIIQEVSATESTSQLPSRRSRPGDLTSREEETEGSKDQQNNLQLSDIAETTKRSAQEVGTAAFLAFNYTVS